MEFNYKHTLKASYVGYITQAIINNLAPLLFLTFQHEFDISLGKIGLVISINFGVQILVDLLAAKWIDRIGYRRGVAAAHLFAAAGLFLMGILPYAMPDPYTAIVIVMGICAIGGGLIEVLISPIVESLPGDEKAAAMSLLHSFYCWGQVGVVLLSTLYFICFGTANWRFLPMLWALIPLLNFFFFLKVPLRSLTEEGEALPFRRLFSAKVFWLMLVLMVCAGSSELSMSQWSSLFAESGLHVSKTVGDLLGPCAFAVLMGLSRVFFGKKGASINLKNALFLSGGLCILSYLITIFSPFPILSLLGCALCGLSVGLMWPGTFSLASECYPQGGTGMFALLALAGDVGAAVGPGLVGYVSGCAGGLAQSLFGGDADSAALKFGLLCAVIFPLILFLGIGALRRQRKELV